MRNYFVNWVLNILYTIMFCIFITAIYCYYFKISFTRFFVYVILPIIQMIYYIFYIINKLLYLPYHIVISLWNALLKILSMFAFLLSFFNSIMIFLFNITDVSYLMAV